MSASGVSETMRHRVAVGDLLASWAARRPDRLCLAMDDREYTFAEMDEMADQVHAGMAGIGVRLGDRVATLAPNRIELLELFHGLARAGVIQVPLNAYLKGTFLRHQLGQSRSRVLVVDRQGRAGIEPLLTELRDLETIIHLDEPDRELVARSGRREIRYSEVTSAGELHAAPDVSASDTIASSIHRARPGCRRAVCSVTATTAVAASSTPLPWSSPTRTSCSPAFPCSMRVGS